MHEKWDCMINIDYCLSYRLLQIQYNVHAIFIKTKRENVSQVDRKRYCFAQFDHMPYHLFTIMETSVCLLYILLKKNAY